MNRYFIELNATGQFYGFGSFSDEWPDAELFNRYDVKLKAMVLRARGFIVTVRKVL